MGPEASRAGCVIAGVDRNDRYSREGGFKE
jgi:hypothetical protein